jgi:heme exporter protein CcmD
MSEVLAMGGYGIFVWPAYGITLSIFLVNLLTIWLENKKIKKLIKHIHEC